MANSLYLGIVRLDKSNSRKMTRTTVTILLTALMLYVKAQDAEYPFPSLSPKGTISQMVGNTMIGIEYERPSVRKRQIFGGLVPWNEIWRTGAAHCTKISFDKSVEVGGQRIEAGIYALFTIPGEKEWVIILNTDTSLSGISNYDAGRDVARFVEIPDESSRFYETLNFDIEILPNDAMIFLSWANVQISFSVETNSDREIQNLIDTELFTRKSSEAVMYAGAAEYYFYKGINLLEALDLADYAISLDSSGWWSNLKIQIFEKLKMYEEALKEIDEYIKNTESMETTEKHRSYLLSQWESHYERIDNLMKQ